VKTMNLRILIADDHDLVRRGVKAIVLEHEGWDVCGEAKTGTKAVTKAKKLQPDIAILDIRMPGINGLEAAKRIRTVSPNTEVLILSLHHSDQLLRELVDAGIRGYIVKSDSERDLVIAVESLANHKAFFTSQATEAIIERFSSGAPMKEVPGTSSGRLTSREREIVQLLAKGNSTKDTASSLGISLKVAEKHRAGIMRKLDIHSISELVLYAFRNQLIEDD
jgi:DNA-binding NarL/FixJ family response regulator